MRKADKFEEGFVSEKRLKEPGADSFDRMPRDCEGQSDPDRFLQQMDKDPDSDRFLQQINKDPDSGRFLQQMNNFPQQLLMEYRPLSCLKANDSWETWLCEGRVSRERFVIKLQPSGESIDLLMNEYRLLKRIHQEVPPGMADCFPDAEGYGESDGFSYLIRRFIPGLSLADYVETQESRVGLSREQTLAIAISILEELSFLHHLQPPILHRDIKPQNIILNTESERAEIGTDTRVSLIDFGIARSLFPDGGACRKGGPVDMGDTFVMGTPHFAPPEQFGYQKTDQRSDVYAVGVVMRYCLTQEYDRRADSRIEPDIRRVIEKATEFDPKNRFSSAEEMLQALRQLKGTGSRFGKKSFRYWSAAFLAVMGLCLVLLISRKGLGQDKNRGQEKNREQERIPEREEIQGQLREQEQVPEQFRKQEQLPEQVEIQGQRREQEQIPEQLPERGEIREQDLNTVRMDTWIFHEPLIEEAVRCQLGSPDGEISMDQLSQITSLHIFGRQIYREEREFSFYGEYVFPRENRYRESGLWEEEGDIKDLSDLKAMPNLREVCLYRQNITDISVLEGTTISFLGLGYNPLTDLSALYGNGNITGLNLSCLSAEIIDVLPSLEHLEQLTISGLGDIRIREMQDLPLKELNLADTWVNDEFFSSFTRLEKLTLSKLYPGLLDKLAGLPLKGLEVTHTAGVILPQLQDLSSLEYLLYDVGVENEPEDLSSQVLRFPCMRELILKHVKIEDLSCLKELKQLEILGIYDSVCEGYGGLDQLSGLKQIFVNKQQKIRLETEYPDAEWKLTQVL